MYNIWMHHLGDPAVEELSFTHSLLINAGTDPFKVITDGIK